MDPLPPAPPSPEPPPQQSSLLDFPPPYSASSAEPAPPPPPLQPPVVFLPPAPPRVWTVFVAFLVGFLVGSIVAGVVAVVVVVATQGPGAVESQERLEAAIMRPPAFLSMLFATQVVLAGVALCGGLLSPVPLGRRLRLGPAVLPWYGYAVLALGTIVLGFTSSIVIEMLGFGDLGVLEEFEKAMAGLRGPVLLIAAAVIGISPGLGEELLFRGYIQTRLRQRWRRLLALVVTSVLFGVIHFDLVQSTFAVFMGLWLGEMTDRTGSIWPAVVGHAVNNAGATVMGALLGGQAPHEQAAIEAPWYLAVSIPLFALCLLYLLRKPVVAAEQDPPAAAFPVTPAVLPSYPAAGAAAPPEQRNAQQ